MAKGGGGGGVRLPPGAYYALTVLTALNVVNLWHRYLVYNLAAVSVEHCDDECDGVSFEPLCYMNEETDEDELRCLACRQAYDTGFYNLKDGACVSTTQYGTLAGPGFTIMFALATLIAGRLTDTLDRRFLHTGAVLVWSLAAAGHGTCTSFNCLLVARVIIGIGEAFNAPACYGLITLYFPKSQRATANGIYSTGTYLGSAVSSLCLTLAGIIGWRVTAFIAGACGVVCGAVLFFTVEHNPVQVSDSPNPELEYDEIPSDDAITVPEKMIKVAPEKELTYSSLASASLVARSGTRGGKTAGPRSTVGEGKGTNGRIMTDNDDGGNVRNAPLPGSDIEGEEFGSFIPRTESSTSSSSSEDRSGSSAGNPFVNDDVDGEKNYPATRAATVTTGSVGASYYKRNYGGVEKDDHRPLLAVTSSFDEAAENAPRYFSGDDDDDVERSGGRSGRGWCVADQRRKRRSGSRTRRKGAGGISSYNAEGEESDPRVHAKHNLGHTVRTILKNRIVLVLFVASSLRMVGTWSMAGYMATYFKRAFAEETSLYSVLNAIFVSTGGMASSYLGGALSDRLRTRDQGVMGYIPAIGCVGAIIPMTFVLFAKSFSVSMTGLFFTYFIGECWLGPGMAVLQNELPTEMAGTSVAILLFLNSVVCNFGTWFISINDSGTDDVRKPFYAMVFLSFTSASVMFALVGYMVSRQDRARRHLISSLESAGIYGNSNSNSNSTAGSDSTKNRNGNSVNFRSLAGARGGGGTVPSNAIDGKYNSKNDGYYEKSASGARGRKGVSMCEMVRRQFSGTSSMTSFDGGYDSSCSQDAGVGSAFSEKRRSSGSRSHNNPPRGSSFGDGAWLPRKSKSIGEAGSRGEREALLMDGWTSGLRTNTVGRV